MGSITKISWADKTFNPWIGCTRVSEGCRFCYAEKWDERYNDGEHWGPGADRRITSKSNWNLPIKWNKMAEAAGVRYRVFCASLADVFDEEAPVGARERLWALIEATPHLDWLLLTKRPQNITSMVPASWLAKPLDNVWYGTTVESNKVISRIDTLSAIPAKVRFISAEPLLEQLVLPATMANIHWIIWGGESHESPLLAREMDPLWVMHGVKDAEVFGTKSFVKQMGARWCLRNKLKDKHGGDNTYNSWPPELQIREFPVGSGY